MDGGDAGSGEGHGRLPWSFDCLHRAGDIDDEEVFFEIFALGDDISVGVEDGGIAIEDQFVVAADLIDVDDGHVPAFGLELKSLWRYSFFPRTKGEAEMLRRIFGTGLRECADGIEMVEGAFEEFFVVPEVFADGDAEPDGLGDCGDFGIGSGLEIAALVEDVVGGEEAFEAFGEDLAVADDGDGVVEGAASVLRGFVRRSRRWR